MNRDQATQVWQQLMKECQRTNTNLSPQPLDLDEVFRLIKEIQDGRRKDERDRLVREIQESFK